MLEGYACAIEIAKLLVNLRHSVSGLAYPRTTRANDGGGRRCD